jgi:hypothetical protein
LFEERHLKPGWITEYFMGGVYYCIVYELDWTTLSSNPVSYSEKCSNPK